ncbi:MAG: bifunctional 3-(3-hydroxy-phenyl)propionate/3-hydroxycinnamic acid hydroxylase, partial [Pseudomonadota bacterium]
LDWPRPQQVTAHGWHASYRLHQPDLERLLRDSLVSLDRCEVKLGATLTDATQSATSVDITYQDNGQPQHCRARYLIGCDGANSTVRQLMASELEDLGFKERWLVVDVLLQQELPALGDHTIQYCDPQQPMTYCRNPGMRRRWEMALPVDISDVQATDETRIWQQLARWITPAVATIERKATYTFRSAVATTWQSGRWLIAGDAAHLTPPFMGQGMCAGIRDAYNLAWKLAAAIANPVHHNLLQTYQQERSHHVREYIATAVRLGKLINSVDTDSHPAPGNGHKTMASPSLSIGTALATQLNLPQSTTCGRLYTQPLLSDNLRFDDHAGYGFALITREPADQHAVRVFNAHEHPELLHTLNQHDAIALLIRPDRYIAAAAHNPTELDQLTAAMKHLPAPHPDNRQVL